MPSDYPKVRYGLEAFQVEHEGKRMILLKDRLGLCENSLLVSPQLAGLLMQMNGENTLRDLQAHHMRTTGEMLFLENLQDVLYKLDEHLFLENERFIRAVAEEVARFQRDPVRRMQYAEKSYPQNPEDLSRMLKDFFYAEAGGPGTIPGSACNRRILGLVAPHIDLTAGGPCFAHAYKAMADADAPETWVILGTGHEPVENYFALTPKDFETPLGVIGCDRECCEIVLERAPRDLRASEYNHKREHTIEFQAVFLAYVQPSARIVPILCSFSKHEWNSEHAYIDEVAGLLRDLAQSVGRPVGFIASVDFAHIGPRYGDTFQPHSGTVAQHLAADRDLFESLEKCAPTEFIQKIGRDENRRKICGTAPLYMLAKILEGKSQGSVLAHSHAVVDNRNSFVTFASMAFYERL